MAILPQGGSAGVSFQTPQQKKQKQQIWMLGGVLLAIAGVLYFGFFRSTGSAPSGPGPIPMGSENMPGGPLTSPIQQGSGQAGANSSAALGTSTEIVLTPEIVEILKQISAADLSVQDKRFGDLVIHGAFPIDIGEKGRKNPFEAF